MYLVEFSHFKKTSKFLKGQSDFPTKLPFGRTLYDTTMIHLSLLRKMFKLWNTSGVFSPPPPLQALGWAWSCASFKTNTIRYGECFSLTKIKLIVPSLLPSTQVLHRSKWFGGGNLAENSRWIMYQMICFSQDKPMESNLIWYIKPAIQMSERLPLVSIQSPRISLSDSSGSLFCRKSSSIPSMKLPSFENATKGRETLFFG